MSTAGSAATRLWPRAIIGVVAGWLLFWGCAVATEVALHLFGSDNGALEQLMLKGALILISLLVWRSLSQGWDRMGWQRPRTSAGVWKWYVLAATAMGSASIAMILLEARHPVAGRLSFLQVVLTIWILSSISEEIFVRGLVQSWIALPLAEEPAPGARRTVVVASAGLFAALHVPLMWLGAGPVGGGIIVAATFFLGWAAAEARVCTRSVWHAIGVHMVGNVAAVPFGIVGVVIYRLAHGHLPPLP